ncbi:MAG: endonuclease/exonuclease/phosphatase family protein [Actinomycetota bacterium]
MTSNARVGTWNLAWPARRPNARTIEIERRIAEFQADVFVATECQLASTPDGWHLLDAGPDWGYRSPGGRRKVQLRSARLWEEVSIDRRAATALDGRLCAGRTDTPIGPLTVLGVCIPWADAHVRTGRADRDRWAEHVDFLAALPAIISDLPRPLLVAGDFNQQLPRTRAPKGVHTALEAAFTELRIVTRGTDRKLIDHIAVSPDLTAGAIELIQPEHDGGQLTDHLGAVTSVGL